MIERARQAGGSWQATVNLSQAGQSAFWPEVALDPAGNALVVWERWSGRNDIVQGAAYEALLTKSGKAA